MARKSFGRNTAWAAIVALALAGSPGLAGIGLSAPAIDTARPAESCANSSASIRQLAMIDSPQDSKFQCLGLSLEGDTVKAIRLETHHFASTGRHAESEQVEIAEFPPSVVESSHGAVLDGIPGHDAIILQGHLAALPAKAELVTSYLYNGFTGEYRSCPITLERAPDAGWRLVNRDAETGSHIEVRTRQMPMFGTFGIAILAGACTQHDRP
jgi:hypothetical protein